MKLEIIRGPAMSGKTTKLQEILRNAGDKGTQGILRGYNLLGAERALRRLAADGMTTIVIDDCSREDLRMLERICKAASADGVTIYAVEAA
jgi:hypothetical protein